MSGPWIDSANALSSHVLDALWRASWQGAIAVGLVWALCRLWRRIPNALRCVLWLLVSVKILLALSPTALELGVLPAIRPPDTVDLPVSSTSWVEYAPSLGEPVFRSFPPVATAPAQPALSASAFLAFAWLIGAIGVVLYAARQVGGSVRLARSATPLCDAGLLAAAEEVRSAMGLRRLPRILVTPEGNSVLTLASWKATVLISSSILEICSPDELRLVLAHEFAHVSRKDAWFGLIPQLVQTLMFFNPLVWLACREFDLAREAACDEMAVAVADADSATYGRLILKLGSRARAVANLFTPGVSSHFRLLRRRIEMLDINLRNPRPIGRRLLALTSIACALCIAPITLVHGQAPSSHTVVMQGTGATSPTKPAAKPTGKLPKAKHILAKAKQKPKPATVQTLPSKGELAPKLEISIFHLNGAKADHVARILNDVLSAAGTKGAKASSDDYSNSVVLVCLPSMKVQLAGVIKHIDELSTPPEKAAKSSAELIGKVYTLTFAKASDVEKVLSDTFAVDSFGHFKIASDERSNSVVINASERQQRQCAGIIPELDRPAGGQGFGRAGGGGGLGGASGSLGAGGLGGGLVQPRFSGTGITDEPKNKLYKVPAALFGDFGNKASRLVHGAHIDTISYGGDENFFIVRGTNDQLAQVDKMYDSLRSHP